MGTTKKKKVTKKKVAKKMAKKKVAKKKALRLRRSSYAAKRRRDYKQMADQALLYAYTKTEKAMDLIQDVSRRLSVARAEHAKETKPIRGNLSVPLWMTRTHIREAMALLSNAQQAIEAAQTGWEGEVR